MFGQPPQAYVDAYWTEVAEELEQVHHAPYADIAAAIVQYRKDMARAGETIYNDSPAENASTMVGHGYFQSVPAVGLGLKLVFQLTDPTKVLDDPMAVIAGCKGFFSELNKRERALGGQGFVIASTESIPGLVTISLRPIYLIGVAKRLMHLNEVLGLTGQQMSPGNDPVEDTRQMFANEFKFTAYIHYQSDAGVLSSATAQLTTLDELIRPMPRGIAIAARFGRNALHAENLMKSEMTKALLAKELFSVWDAVNEINMAKGLGVISTR
jgi:hypothetical protein